MQTIEEPPRKVNRRFVPAAKHAEIKRQRDLLKQRAQRLALKVARQEKLIEALAAMDFRPQQDPQRLAVVKNLLPKRKGPKRRAGK